ncbi:hypothetical protein I4U23_015268 [Adineta vaga]|nr:hypothetical protein I4U23_015268 [Adineta vaga]
MSMNRILLQYVSLLFLLPIINVNGKSITAAQMAADKTRLAELHWSWLHQNTSDPLPKYFKAICDVVVDCCTEKHLPKHLTKFTVDFNVLCFGSINPPNASSLLQQCQSTMEKLEKLDTSHTINELYWWIDIAKMNCTAQEFHTFACGYGDKIDVKVCVEKVLDDIAEKFNISHYPNFYIEFVDKIGNYFDNTTRNI